MRLRMRPPMTRRIALLALLASTAALTGCAVYDDVFGTGSSKRTILTAQSISLSSDHPASAGDPTGPAVIGSNDTIRFTTLGTFTVNGTATLTTNDCTAGVVWTSSNPSLALPGADGRVMAHGSAGTALITATSPALGTIPALTSNSISLTIQ